MTTADESGLGGERLDHIPDVSCSALEYDVRVIKVISNGQQRDGPRVQHATSDFNSRAKAIFVEAIVQVRPWQ